MSSKLKTLKLNGQWLINDGSLRCMEIFAPYIQHLEISGGLYDLKCILVKVSAVVTAKLAFNIMCIKDINYDYGLHFDPEENSCSGYHQFFRSLVHGYLLTFRNVKELTIGTWLTEVLCMLLFKGTVLPEMKCKYLTLELHVKSLKIPTATLSYQIWSKEMILICKIGFYLGFPTSRMLRLSTPPESGALRIISNRALTSF
ncbi:hypothetical protein KY285_022383 [Solanum tuberosum]|nr:hypothetical protein KY285_022383 [Solanum tuberosum]